MSICSGSDHARLQHTEIPARPTCCLHLTRHVGKVESQVQFPARLAALRQFDESTTDLKVVAEAEIVLRNAIDHQVLAESAWRKAVCCVRKFARPCLIVNNRVCVKSLVESSMVAPVALLIILEPVGCRKKRPVGRLFVDG